MSWQEYSVGTNQIIATHYQGRDCYQMTAAADEPCDKWGDGLEDGNGNVVHRKRAQFKQEHDQPLEQVYTLDFSTLIPSDWDTTKVDTSIFDLHSYGASGAWDLGVRGSTIRLWSNFIEDQPTWLMVTEQWDDWRLEHFPSMESGWFKLYRNGNLLFDIGGCQTANEPRGMYAKIGPYFHYRFGDGRIPPVYRRMYIQKPRT